MMADITLALADAGISICSCAAEVDRGRGMVVILFHVEARLDNLPISSHLLRLVLLPQNFRSQSLGAGGTLLSKENVYMIFLS
ncbi:hypothetical protein L1987_81399 [Smallanthus sonchifolius]|uniref:Uncharacterized protein n=1 Tax=Smallanthus sonchifolius TaxID=185202 RepID=A0ACB8YQX7_9ASTR|nr:hypothetical protein L1987_81399 [Smallanthus sonchifolius]